MKHALRRYVQAEEPPFPLTASALISQAKRRQRWRLGLGICGGAAATTLAIVSAFAVMPVTGGPTLSGACDVQLPLGPSGLRPYPLGTPSGSYESPPPTVLATAGPTSLPTPEPATPDPGWPGSPLPTAPPMTATPGPTPTGSPVPEPGLPTGKSVDRRKVDELSCFVKRRVLEMRPGATFIGDGFRAPMEPVALDFGWGQNGPPVGYAVVAWIVDEPVPSMISVTVWDSNNGPEPQFVQQRSETVAIVRTGSTTIRVYADNKAITDEQVWELANAPELDLYR